MNSDRQASERQAQADAAQQQQQNTNQQQQDRPKSDNPYVFSDEEKTLWGDAVNMDTGIARAWSRAAKGGNNVGRPLGDEYKYTDTELRQDFQFGFASFN